MSDREEKKEVFALDVIAIETEGVREELRCICRELRRLNEFLRAVKSIQITQQGETMGVINGIKVGSTGTFDAAPQPAGTSFNGVLPVFTSSDPTNTSLTPSTTLNTDGTASVNVLTNASAPVGSSFSLTATWTATDGSGATATGTASVPYLAGAVVNPTSIDISQTA